MILYIDSNNVYLLNDGYSKVIYTAHKDKIDYLKLIFLIKKNKLFVFINSFYATSEHKTFAVGMTANNIQNFIKDRLAKPDVICACYNHLFNKGKGAEHKNDIVMTLIKDNENEPHIKRIFTELLKTDLDLSHIYSFDQVINTIGISRSVLNRSLNLNVVMLETSALIMASNTTHYMFGRLIKQHDKEPLLTTTAKMLAMALKYISTTYAFLHNEVKITIMSASRPDVDAIKATDPVLKSVIINTKILKLPSIKIAKEVPEIIAELQLLKLAIPEIKYVNNLTNNQILSHIKTHKTIKILRLSSIIALIAAILYNIYSYISSTKLSDSDALVDRQYNAIVQNITHEEKKIKKLDNKIYAIIATNIKKYINNDNSHFNATKIVSKVFNNYKKLVYVEGYRFNCENCINNKRKNTLYVDFALFNVNSSARFAINKLAEIENEIKKELRKKYDNVEITLQQISRERQIATTRDVRDTMVITYYK